MAIEGLIPHLSIQTLELLHQANASENETSNIRKQLCGDRKTIRNNVQSIKMN